MDFAQAPETWQRVIFDPGDATFAAELEKEHATLGTAVIWMLGASVVAALLSIIGGVVSSFTAGGSIGLLEPILLGVGLSPGQVESIMTFQGGGVVSTAFGSFCATLIGLPISFLLSGIILFLVAKLFDGTGTFDQHMYILATFSAPLYALSAGLSIIPCLGAVLTVVTALYIMVLAAFALKVTHQLDMEYAVIVALAPTVLLFVCICVTVAAAVTVISETAASMTPSVFQIGL